MVIVGNHRIEEKLQKKLKLPELSDIGRTASEFGIEMFDNELVREIAKLDVTKTYSPNDFAIISRRAKSRAEQRLKEVR